MLFVNIKNDPKHHSILVIMYNNWDVFSKYRWIFSNCYWNTSVALVALIKSTESNTASGQHTTQTSQ